MPVSLAESQAVAEIAELLYDFLPGKPYPYADPRISFQGVAHDAGLSGLWKGGSKLPAISALLDRTLATRRDLFCKLAVEIVRRGIAYRNNKGNPIARDEIRLLNDLITRVGFKIPELWDSAFLDSLPSAQVGPPAPKEEITQEALGVLRNEFLDLSSVQPQPRGYAFEKFLNKLFAAFDLQPRTPFRLKGEQIDGSLDHDGHTYLVEARWQNQPVGARDLLAFHEQVEGKSSWSRGLFISHSGFSEDGLVAFARGRATSIIGLTGQDLYFILSAELSLATAISQKARRAAEAGEFLATVQELSLRR